MGPLSPGRALVALASAAAATVASCAGLRAPFGPIAEAGPAACAGLTPSACGRAEGLLHAATAFGNVQHEYLLDTASALVPGRGVERGSEGAYRVLPTRCAAARDGAPLARVDPSIVDFTYVGVAVDERLVGADVELSSVVSAGVEGKETKLSLVALAFVRELDPQFFGASEEVAFAGDACTCGRATHFVGSVKMGGALAYEMTVRKGEVHGRALDLFKAHLARGDTRVTQTVAGGLEVEGLDAVVGSPAAGAPRPLTFKVKQPVPVAYALYPLSDVCRFSFPTPEVLPEALDFGEVPYGTEETRLLHVVNRAAVELRATLGERTFAVPALGSADVPLTWRPAGDRLGCEELTREDTLQFTPRDAALPVTPRSQAVRVKARVRTGKATFRRHEHVDTGVHRKPDYVATRRDFECPPGYALAACRTERAECGDGRCATDGYAVNAEPTANGCRFQCSGPEGLIPGISSMFCRFDAVMECRLRCR
jgi:hypothetical protein